MSDAEAESGIPTPDELQPFSKSLERLVPLIRRIVREELATQKAAGQHLRIQIAPTTIQLDGKAIGEIVWPVIQQRVDDDLGDDLAVLGVPSP